MNMNSNQQDWNPVVIRKRPPTAAQMKDEAAVNAARRAGHQIETVKKQGTGATTASGKSARKLDEETEDFKRTFFLSANPGANCSIFALSFFGWERSQYYDLIVTALAVSSVPSNRNCYVWRGERQQARASKTQPAPELAYYEWLQYFANI